MEHGHAPHEQGVLFAGHPVLQVAHVAASLPGGMLDGAPTGPEYSGGGQACSGLTSIEPFSTSC